jgi:iron complex outermembrane receptor protein
MTKLVPFKKLVVASVCASIASISLAQTLDEVVVSVSGQEQSAFDTPAAIQAIDQSVIQNSGPQVNLSESLNRVPGLVVLNRQNYAQDLQLSIRGSGSRAAFGIRGSRLIVDGIPATMPDGQGQASTISLPSAKRIEVLRGPMAQMYGNSSAGVIQVFSVEGTEVPQLKTSIDSGPNGMQRLGFQATGTLNDVGYVIDHSDFKTDGFRRHSAAKRKHTNAKLTATLYEGTKLSLTGNFFDMPLSQDPRGLDRDQIHADRRQAGTGALAFNTGKEVSQNQLGLVSETQMSSSSDLMFRIYYGERELGNRLGLPGGGPLQSGGIVELARKFKGLGFRYNSTHAIGEGAVTLSVGAELEDMKERRKGFVNNAGVKGDLRRDEDNSATGVGVFGQANWMMNEDWSLILGLRANQVRFKVKDYYVVGANRDDSGGVKFKATNPVLGVTRLLSPQTNLFFNYGRGFETPTLAEIAYRPLSEGTGPNLDLMAAKSNHYELGFKTRISDRQRLDISYFLIDTKNEIVVAGNEGGRSIFTNAASTRRTGVEVAHSVEWSKEIRSYFALTTLDAKFRDSTSSRTPKGNYIPGTMDKQLFAELSWQPAVMNGFRSNLELVYQGKIRVNDSNEAATKGATVANIRFGWDRQYGSWAINSYIRVDNVTDKKYVGSVIANDTNGRFYEPASGRQVGVGLSATYSF